MPIQPVESRTSSTKRAASSGKAVVYNPDSSALTFKYAGKEYTLKPNSKTELPHTLADHAYRTLAVWGVRIVNSPEDVAEAEAAHKAAVDQWATDVLVAEADKRQKLQAAGVPIKDSPEVTRAREWLNRK